MLDIKKISSKLFFVFCILVCLICILFFQSKPSKEEFVSEDLKCFDAKILKVFPKYIIVEPINFPLDCDTLRVNFGKNSCSVCSVGVEVEICYSGGIDESDPAQIYSHSIK